MQQYILLKKLNVQNANAIAGLTYGFPSITNFLGFAHALSRQLPAHLGISLGGVAVISHNNNVHARQPKGWGDYVFALTRNPLTQQGNTAPINEEGRMNMQISLLIAVNGLVAGDAQTEQALIQTLLNTIPTMRIAGGQLTSFEACEVLSDDQSQQTALRRLMPGFILLDRSDYLQAHYANLKKSKPEANLFDAWCDFSKLKYQATIDKNEQGDIEQSSQDKPLKATWKYVAKPNAGYLVPIATGYFAISKLYDAADVANVRDNTVPVAFTETAYNVGEWQSVHRLQNINIGIWHYTDQHPWYIAKSQSTTPLILEPDTDIAESENVFEPDYL
jgi:CRISPR-associated protein Csy2